MPKFPDPTTNYQPKPLDKPLSPPPTPQFKPPASQDTPPTSSSSSSSQTPPPPSPPKSSFLNLSHFLPLILGLGFFILIFTLIFKVLLPKLHSSSSSSSHSPQITLTYWGLWEPKEIMEPLIADFERQHPNIKINYVMQSPQNYRTRLQTAIQNKQGPDIVRIHNTWLPMLQSYLAPAPADIIPLSYLDDFYPVVKDDFVRNNNIYALPIMIDGLALYYNPAFVSQPPTDWNQLRQLAFQLTQHDSQTQAITRAGLAMGTSDNVAHFSDVIGLLALQNNADLTQPDSSAMRDVLTFYTIFATQDHTWDKTQPDSTYAFATQTLAMMFAPAWQAPTIKALNPSLHFKTAPTPNLPQVSLAWATYWAEAVSASSSHQKEAWQFIQFLTQPQTLQKLYNSQVALRGYGTPYPRLSLANLLQDDPVMGAFVTQAPHYKSWYLASRTYDNGLNDQLIQYYRDAINSLNEGNSLDSVISTLSQGVNQVLSKFRLQ